MLYTYSTSYQAIPPEWLVLFTVLSVLFNQSISSHLLVDKIKEKTREILNKNDEQLCKENEEKQNKKVEIQEVDEKMADEEVKKQDKLLSYTKLIIKALEVKGIKNIDDAVAKVLEWRPGRDAKKVKAQMKSIIYLVKTKKGAKRWNSYIWDEEQFSLTEIASE